MPFHKRIFGSTVPKTLENPGFLCIEGARCLFSSGENVQDILKYAPQECCEDLDMPNKRPHTDANFSVEQVLDAMKVIMECQHTSPTSPDTLKCEPIDESDPFIIKDSLHFFFCGNSPEAGVRSLKDKGTCLVSVPNFSRSGNIVIFDTKTLELELVTLVVEKEHGVDL